MSAGHALIAFSVTLISIYLLRPVAVKVGLVDRPGGRKTHDGEIPLIGGPAMYLGLVAFALGMTSQLPALLPLLMGCTLLLIIGIIDDRKAIAPWPRLIAQILAAALVVYPGGTQLHTLGNLFGGGEVLLGDLAGPFTIFAIVGVINAMNMMDGLDGLGGGLALVSLTFLAALAWKAGLTNEAHLILGVIAVVVAFLLHNMRTPWRQRASIFMGDSGSMMLGLFLAWALIHLSQPPHQALTPASALWLFALPLLDTVCIMLRRIVKGRSPFSPDREHLHHILLVAGYSPTSTTFILLGLATSLAILATTATRLFPLTEPHLFLLFLLLFAAYSWAMAHAWKLARLLKRVSQEH